MSSTAMSASNILSIPAEVIEYALTFCPPTAVASFSQTCRLANAIVYESPDQYLWRQLFLLYPFDDPRKSIHGSIIRRVDWRTELQRRIRAKAIAFSPAGRPVQCKIQALQTFITMVHEAAPLSKDQRPLPSDNITWLSRVLDDSHTRILGSHHLPTTPVLARLRSYVTLLTSLSSSAPSVTQAYLQSQRTHSRCMVYDLRNYRAENNWGPYQNDGKKVNWRHMEAIVNVICGNLSELPGPLLYRRLPGGLEATRPYSAPGTLDRDPRDWAGVVGTWRRYVCFMDYRDLFEFNFSGPDIGPRDPSFFVHPSFQEATRLIEVKFRLIDPREMHAKASAYARRFAQDDLADWDLDDGSDIRSDMKSTTDVRTRLDSPIHSMFPPSYYSGVTRGVSGNEATVEGVVRMGPDRVVRWHFTTVYDNGQTEWCSEGVQIGNVGSAAGVAGVWTGVDHSPEDPVGPFWLWKVEGGHPMDLIDFD